MAEGYPVFFLLLSINPFSFDYSIAGNTTALTGWTQTMEKDQIYNVIRLWENAIQAGDIIGILANHTEDILMFDVPEPLQSRGLDEYKKTWELFFRYGSPGNEVFVIEELQVTAGSDVAFATGLLRISGSKAPICRLTLGLRKERGRWLIAHEHHSAPHKLRD